MILDLGVFKSPNLLQMVGRGWQAGDSKEYREENELIFIPNYLTLLLNNICGNIIPMINPNSNNKVS